MHALAQPQWYLNVTWSNIGWGWGGLSVYSYFMSCHKNVIVPVHILFIWQTFLALKVSTKLLIWREDCCTKIKLVLRCGLFAQYLLLLHSQCKTTATILIFFKCYYSPTLFSKCWYMGYLTLLLQSLQVCILLDHNIKIGAKEMHQWLKNVLSLWLL